MKSKPLISPQDDSEQSRRFIDMARELGADETGEAFDRAFKKVARRLPREPKERPASKGRVSTGKTRGD
jgi:hypothetical protein